MTIYYTDAVVQADGISSELHARALYALHLQICELDAQSFMAASWPLLNKHTRDFGPVMRVFSDSKTALHQWQRSLIPYQKQNLLRLLHILETPDLADRDEFYWQGYVRAPRKYGLSHVKRIARRAAAKGEPMTEEMQAIMKDKLKLRLEEAQSKGKAALLALDLPSKSTGQNTVKMGILPKKIATPDTPFARISEGGKAYGLGYAIPIL